MGGRETIESRLERTVAEKCLTAGAVKLFRKLVYGYYREHGRSFPWRETRDPYHILVSEIMLQQTRTERVAAKFGKFIDAYPDFRALARAPLAAVLRTWQGLGYNRRALALKKISRIVMEEHGGSLPSRVEDLEKLPGIGTTTACEIAAFAFNEPTAFIETNIRSVFIHHFFKGSYGINDAEILPLVSKTLDRSDPRKWYYALMDYGVMLKEKHPNPSKKSAHYRRQSPFKGSNREVRGKVLGALLGKKGVAEYRLAEELDIGRERVGKALDQLLEEGFIKESKGRYTIS
jgi:A/G-specific adenine glycosylase